VLKCSLLIIHVSWLRYNTLACSDFGLFKKKVNPEAEVDINLRRIFKRPFCSYLGIFKGFSILFLNFYFILKLEAVHINA
jgi:hypothetical protein